MSVIVREACGSGGPCAVLGTLVSETSTRYIYRRRPEWANSIRLQALAGAPYRAVQVVPRSPGVALRLPAGRHRSTLDK